MLILLTFTISLYANNIAVGTVTITDINTTSHYANLQFNLSWDNSWRTSDAPYNWDAAWLFGKWKLQNGTEWAHCTLSTTDEHHTAPTGSTIDAASDGLGVVIYRDEDGTGTNTWNNVKLRWEYGTDGVADNATVFVKVFAIEMVYVPQSEFVLGSGGSESGHFYEYTDGSQTTNTYRVDSEDAITIGTSNGNLWGTSTSGNNRIGDAGTLPADFPKGYDSFYCMKYEMSQGQFADFLNTLTYDQQDTYTATAPNVAGQVNSNNDRNGLEVQTAGTDNTIPALYGIDLNNDGGNLGENIVANYLCWADGCAYADWAGLRPMTELEFEKACRGQSVTVNEYAWGTTAIAASEYSVDNAGEYNEGISSNYSTSSGNCYYSGTLGLTYGPLRCGIFAANASNTGRVTSGATYYGIMEMSGNLLECIIGIARIEGRNFTGTHGNGDVEDTPTNWPTDIASGLRGGHYESSTDNIRVSDRNVAAYNATSRSYHYGFRAVRTW